MIRLADYVAQFLVQKGIKHVFMVTGGGAMFLNDAIGHCDGLEYICCHHEQACAMAAEAYARINGGPGVINVTTGPGGINAMNGVFGAWTDSIPLLIISGQVKRETCMASYSLPGLRQLGDQEADIVSIAKTITKYAVLVQDPKSIRYHLEKAFYLAIHGRPGPCWLDIPVDVQSAMVDEKVLQGYDSSQDKLKIDSDLLSQQCRNVIERLKTSARPVIMVGNGLRLSNGMGIFETVIRKLVIPVTTAWTGIDIMASDDPLYCGRPGTIGDRAGNFTVQNSDFLLVIGSRLNIRQVSYNWKSFARYAFKIIVDIDKSEFNKPTIKPDLPVCCDARLFLEELNRQLELSDFKSDRHVGWLKWCKERVLHYPVVLPRHRLGGMQINPYHFIDELFQHLIDDDVVVCGNGTACVIPLQAAYVKKGQRLLVNSGDASMGYDLPAAIGASFARTGKRVICIAGDGSMQMNIQEMQTIVHHQLPIKIFVLNNGGYLSIRQTQTGFFKRLTGESPASGVSFPNITKIAAAYGIPSLRIDNNKVSSKINDVLTSNHAYLGEVILDPNQGFEPRITSKQLPDGSIVSANLEDMYPFLDRNELITNILFDEDNI